MEELGKIELANLELVGKPLFTKRIFHNQVTYEADERKLFKHGSATQSAFMCAGGPGRIICKMYDPTIFKDDTRIQEK